MFSPPNSAHDNVAGETKRIPKKTRKPLKPVAVVPESLVNQIFNDDCIEGMARIPSATIPLIVTDIPYGVVSRASGGIRVFDKKQADVCNISLPKLIAEFSRISAGSVYIFCGTEQVSELRALLVNEGFTTRLCIWEKTNPTPVNGQHLWLSGVECCVFGRKKGATFNEHCKNTVWRFPNGRSKRHPTEKPLPLFEYLVNVSSAPGDIVFDPFMGSGTTAEASLRLGRKYLGFELDKGYYEIAVERVKGAKRGS